MKYVIKSVLFDDYFVGLKKIKNAQNYKVYWSQRKSDAIKFNTYKEASDKLCIVYGLFEEDLQLEVDKIEDYEIEDED